MPNRILKESICTSDNLNMLSWQEEVLFYRLLVNCDDFGRFDARPSILRARCFPLRITTVDEKQVLCWLQSLICHGLVQVYEVEGQRFLQVCTWDKHQQIRAKRSKYPTPDSNGNHLIANDSICSRNPIQSESESNPNASKHLLADAITSTKRVTQKFGEFLNVLLTPTEHQKLVERFGERGATDRIEELSLAKASKGYKTKSDYATILNWARRNDKNKPVEKSVEGW